MFLREGGHCGELLRQEGAEGEGKWEWGQEHCSDCDGNWNLSLALQIDVKRGVSRSFADKIGV